MKSGVDRCVAWSFIISMTVVFGSSWLAVAVSDFGSARVAGVVAFASKPVVFSRTKASH